MANKEIFKQDKGLINRIDNAISITNKLLNVDFRKIYAIHLDDQKLFSDAVKKAITPLFPNLIIDSFQAPNSALAHFEYCLRNKIKIDFIISDIKHPEPDGFVFSRTIREIETKYNKRIPILIISMMVSEPLWPKILEFLDDKTWDKVLGKTASEDKISEAIKEIIE